MKGLIVYCPLVTVKAALMTPSRSGFWDRKRGVWHTLRKLSLGKAPLLLFITCALSGVVWKNESFIWF